MRETFGTLTKTSQNYAIDPSATSNTNLDDARTFLKHEINNTVGFILSRLRIYKTQKLPQTMTTTADRIYNHYPPGIDSIESATMTIGGVNYPLEAVSSHAEWDNLQLIEIASSTIPKYFFPRAEDFGIYPTPTDANTVTLTINPMAKDMTADDVSGGSITTTQNSVTVTGSGTTFTAGMVGRYFRATDDGDWYKVATFTSTTEIALQSVFEGSSISGGAYVIGESPNIPLELHEFIPWRAASAYYAAPRRNTAKGQDYLNMFWTGDYKNFNRTGKIEGGLLGAINRYKTRGRANSQLVRMGKRRFDYHDERWAITLTE